MPRLLTPSSNHPPIAPQVWCYFVAFFVLALGAAALGPTLVELAKQTESDLSDISILFSMRALGYLLMARVIGQVYDRSSSGHRVMSLAMVAMGGLFFFVPLITHLWVLAPTIFLIGVAGAFVDLGGNVLLLWAVKNDIGPSMNGLHFSFGLGAFVSPLVIGLLLAMTAQQDGSGGSGIYIYWMISLLTLPLAYWIFKTPSPDHPVVSKKYEAPPSISPFVLGVIVLFFFFVWGKRAKLWGLDSYVRCASKWYD